MSDLVDIKNWKFTLWGHKKNSDTFFYIHNAYYRAFKHLGAQVSWYDDNDDIRNVDFSNTMFFTEGQVDKRIPLRDDCLYILHNCEFEKYKALFEKNRCFRMQVYTDDVLKYKIPELTNCIHADYANKCIYYPWATDLLPHEIDANKPAQAFNSASNIVNWVGTVGAGIFGNIDQITPFKNACKQNGIGFSNIMQVSIEENVKRIKNSYMAPTIVGKWQHEVGYIPCRVFKNISYGQMGITNSPRIYELFQHKIIHNSDTNQLFYDAKSYLQAMQVSELHSLMDFVRDNHTYLNRIDTVFNFVNHILGH